MPLTIRVQMKFIERHGQAQRVRGQFDVAVDDDDRLRDDVITTYLVPIELIRKMSDMGIDIMFSMYWFPDASSESTNQAIQ